MTKETQINEQQAIKEAVLACPVNSTIELQIFSTPKSYRLFSELMAVNYPDTLSIKLKSDGEWSEASQQLQVNQPLILNILNETGLCNQFACRTEIKEIIRKSPESLQLELPHTLEATRLRQTSRVKLQQPCTLSLDWQEPPAPEHIYNAELIDLSTEGCRVKCELAEPFPHNSQLNLNFRGYEPLTGQIRNYYRDGNTVFHGIQFTALTEEMEAMVGELIHQHSIKES